MDAGQTTVQPTCCHGSDPWTNRQSIRPGAPVHGAPSASGSDALHGDEQRLLHDSRQSEPSVFKNQDQTVCLLFSCYNCAFRNSRAGTMVAITLEQLLDSFSFLSATIVGF
jgi:hypothetical protein